MSSFSTESCFAVNTNIHFARMRWKSVLSHSKEPNLSIAGELKNLIWNASVAIACEDPGLLSASSLQPIYKTAQDPVTAYWEHLNQCQQRFPSIFALGGREEWVSAFRVSTGVVGIERSEKALQPQRIGIGLFSWQLNVSSLMWYGGHLCICLGNSKCFNLPFVTQTDLWSGATGTLRVD